MTLSYNKKFFRKTGYKVTDDIIESDDLTEELSEILYECNMGAKSQPALYEKKIRKYIEQYPNQASLWNYLYAALMMQGKKGQAVKILDRTLEKFPNYLFGRTNKALNLSHKGKYEEALQYLGASLDIKDIITDRDIYHFTEFIGYYGTVVQYAVETNNNDLAEEKHKLLFEYDPENPQVKTLAKGVLATRIQRLQGKIEGQKQFEVESFPTVKFPTKKEFPEFENELIQELYQHAEEGFPEPLIEKLMELPRESLIRDLEKVLEDSISRQKFLEKKYKEWNEEELCFPVHALYFLSALEATTSLNTILNILRQGEEFLDYWYADALEMYLFYPLFFLGKDQLPLLKAYFKESNQSSWAKLTVTSAVSQIALHEPERRTEVLAFFQEVYEYYLANPKDETLIDGTFIGSSVGHLIDIRAVELLPIIKQLYDQEWIPTIIQGDLDDIEKALKRPNDPGEKQEMPENIYEYYNRAYQDRQLEIQSHLTEEDLEKMNDPYNEYLMQYMLRGLLKDNSSSFSDDDYHYDDENYYDDYEVVETFKREKPKLGRNDPCHCGSGKKYKKCCLKKDKAAGKI